MQYSSGWKFVGLDTVSKMVYVVISLDEFNVLSLLI